jgi:hypothetical protein
VPEGWNGSKSGIELVPTVAAQASWSPAACCSTWVTFQFAHGVGRSQAPAGTPATVVRSAWRAAGSTFVMIASE